MSFIHEDFLLDNATARRLYHEFAEDEPILDYHCHLPPKDVAENRRFSNLFEIWLEGDHYKWRAMRANGVRRALLHRRRRPVREVPGLGAHRAAHAAQSALPLDAPGAEALLRHRRPARRDHRAARSGSAPTSCWPREDLRAHGILQEVPRQGASAPPTTRPTTSRITSAIAASGLATQCLPDVPARQGAERPPAGGVQRLGGPAGGGRRRRHPRPAPTCSTRSRKRHDFFHADGRPPVRPRAEPLLRRFLHRRRRRAHLRPGPRAARRPRRPSRRQFARVPDAVLRPAGRREGLDQAAPPGRAPQQQHARCSRQLGPDTGFDSIGDWPQVDALARLPRPAGRRRTRCRRRSSTTSTRPTTTCCATMIGNFQDGAHRGQDPVRQRLVVPRPEGRHGVADQRAVQPRPALALRRHADRLALVHVLPAPRVLPPHAVQPDRRATSSRARSRTTTSWSGGMIRNICYENARQYLGLGI